MNEIAQNVERRGLSIRPGTKDALHINKAVRDALLERFCLTQVDKTLVVEELYAVWLSNRYPPLTEKDIKRLWETPTDLLITHAELFYKLPEYLRVRSQVLYTGDWLHLWKTTYDQQAEAATHHASVRKAAARVEASSVSTDIPSTRIHEVSAPPPPKAPPRQPSEAEVKPSQEASILETPAPPMPGPIKPVGLAPLTTYLKLTPISPEDLLSDQSIFDPLPGRSRKEKIPENVVDHKIFTPKRPQGMQLNTHSFFAREAGKICCYEVEISEDSDKALRCTNELAKGSRNRCLLHLGRP